MAGFTIVELLVALVLFAIISIPVWKLLFSESSYFNTQGAATATQQNTRAALRRVSQDMMLAGRGINTLSLKNPGVVIPNDGTVALNVVQPGAITLLSIPTPVAQIPFAAAAPKGAQAITVVDDVAGVARNLIPGRNITVHETNLNNSQILAVTTVKDNGPTVTLSFAAADSLLTPYPLATSRMYPMDRVGYRINAADSLHPFLERRVNVSAWEKMVPGIKRLAITYFDSKNTLITPTTPKLRKDIRKMRVEVEGMSEAVDARGKRVSFKMDTEITPRNLLN